MIYTWRNQQSYSFYLIGEGHNFSVKTTVTLKYNHIYSVRENCNIKVFATCGQLAGQLAEHWSPHRLTFVMRVKNSENTLDLYTQHKGWQTLVAHACAMFLFTHLSCPLSNSALLALVYVWSSIDLTVLLFLFFFFLLLCFRFYCRYTVAQERIRQRQLKKALQNKVSTEGLKEPLQDV